MVLFLLLSFLFPSFTWGETSGAPAVSAPIKERLAASTQIPEGSADTANSQSENEPQTSEKLETEPQTSAPQQTDRSSEESEAVSESTKEGAEESNKEQPENRTARAASPLNERLEVTKWGIYDASGTQLSGSNPAISNGAYTLKFDWKIDNLAEERIQPGDYFTVVIPQNEGTLPDKSDANGRWATNTSTSSTPILVAINGSMVKIGEWFLESSPEYNYQTQHIRIQFTSGVSQVTATTISGTSFNIGNEALKNYTLKAGIQNVAFGGTTQEIYFNARELDKANGYSYKNAMGAGHNLVEFSIPVNLPTAIELGGDEFDNEKNPGTGWHFNAGEPPHQWGERATNVKGIFVEDELEAGATIGNLTISADTRIPILMPFTEQHPYDGSQHKGGIISSDSAFLSYVLFDSGNGPEYRTSASSDMHQKPTQQTSFDRLYQNQGESKSAFKARVKARDYQYGIYHEKATNKQTLMLYFGDVANGDTEAHKSKKFSDLTDQKLAPSGRLVKGTEGSKKIPVLNFAVKSADYLIKNGYYTAADRELIEDYFTLTFGDSNCIGGQASTFNITMLVRYPLATASGEKSNTVTFHQSSSKVISETNPQSRSATTWLNNPYNSIQLQANEAALFKTDEKNRPLTGVKFGLEKKAADGTWKPVAGKAYTTGAVVVPVTIIESNGEETVQQQSLDGGFLTGLLPDGTYRFVELETPADYDKTLSPDYDTAEKKILSASFNVPSEGNAKVRHVTNVSSPTYKVSHFVQKDPASSTSPEDFVLNYQETLRGDTGSTVTAAERIFSGYSFLAGHSLEVKTGKITADGSLQLKLYYKIDNDVSPFSINKVDTNKNPMPSYNTRGDPLGPDKTVQFDVYVVDRYDGGRIETTHPEKDAHQVWKHLVLDGKAVTVTTDAEGRIRDSKIELVKRRDSAGEVLETEILALVEKRTYKGYQLPDVGSQKNCYWVVYTSQTADKRNAEISWVNAIGLNGTENPGAGQEADGSFYITNKKEGWALYKETASGDKMPSMDQDGALLEEKVTFQLYRYTNNWGSFPPGDYSPADERAWALMEGYTYTTDSNGMLVGEREIPTENGENYALVETSTYSGYHCPSPRQAYWILWDGGGLSSHGINSPGDRYIANYSYALKNDRATDTALYKVDEKTRRVMPSTEKQHVAFKYYKYTGNWTEQDNPDVAPLTDSTKWLPLIDPAYSLTDPSEEKFLFQTDAQGRLPCINELFVGAKGGTTYGIQEVHTYSGYKKAAGHWIVYVKPEIAGDAASSYIVDSMGYTPSGYPVVGPKEPGNPFGHFLLTNEAYQYPSLHFTKENENRDPLEHVRFELYSGKKNGQWGVDSEDPKASDTYWKMDEPYREASSSLSGATAFDRLEPGRYLLIETKTGPEYQLPDGEWVITVAERENKIEITEIRARSGTSPPAFRKEGETYYLPNYLKTSLPRAGGYLKMITLMAGIVLLGAMVLLIQNGRRDKKEKGNKNEKEVV